MRKLMDVDHYDVVDTGCKAVVSTQTLLGSVQEYTEGQWNAFCRI